MGRRPISRARTNRFLVRVLLSGFMEKLLIPREYAMLHAETLGKKCVLWPTHTRDSWLVRTELIDNELYFKKGWGEFAKHHSLQFGDMLIFRHVKNSEFDVDVVDKSGTAKETLASKKDQLMKDRTAPLPPTSRQKNAILDSAALTAAEAFISSSEYPSFKKTMTAAYVQKSGGYLHVPLDYSKEHMKDYQGTVKIEELDKVWTVKAVRRPCETRTLFSSGWSDLARANSLQVNDVCVFQLLNTKDYTLKLTIFRHASEKNQKQCQAESKCSCTERNMKSKELSLKAIEEAENFQSRSKYPSVVIVMQAAYVESGYLHVPSAFRQKICKKEGDKEVKLQWSGEVRRAVMRIVRGQCRITAGWGTFVKDKAIEVDDVCVLEFINREDDDVIVIKITNFKCNC